MQDYAQEVGLQIQNQRQRRTQIQGVGEPLSENETQILELIVCTKILVQKLKLRFCFPVFFIDAASCVTGM